ncbi:hypothetical protein QEH59_18855, partial [Coraliomargarita sp. SDUM461004]
LDYQVPSEQTALAYNKNSELMGISYDANSTLVSVGRAATVLRKHGSGAWSPINTSVSASHILEAIAYGAGYFICVGHASTPNYNGEVAVYRSSDGANWEDLSNGTGLDSWQDFR